MFRCKHPSQQIIDRKEFLYNQMYSHLSQAGWAYPSSLSDPLHYPLSIAFYSNLEHTYFLLFPHVDYSLFSSASIISCITFTEQISCIYIFLITFYWELEPSYFLSHFHFLLVWYWKLCQKLSFGPALFLSRFHTPPFSNFPPKNYSLFIWCAPLPGPTLTACFSHGLLASNTCLSASPLTQRCDRWKPPINRKIYVASDQEFIWCSKGGTVSVDPGSGPN